MRETERIEDQLRRSIEGPAWHGPSLLELLRTVDAQHAAAKPVRDLHSIWEIVGHVTAWQDVVRRRLGGEVIGDLPPEQNFPPVTDASAVAWQREIDRLEGSSQDLRRAILTLAEEALDAPVRGKNYNVYVMLHGTVQHNLYHAGQIAILRKAP
jgi:uncharacterized damage-inducible protein DinB